MAGSLAASPRIQVGFAIQLYGNDAYEDLRNINKIRNAFAHQLEAKDFNYYRIKDRANNLRLPKIYPVERGNVIASYKLFPFLVAFVRHSVTEEPTDARGKFIRASETLSLFLWGEDYYARSTGIPAGALPPQPRF